MLLDSTICDFGWKAQDFHLKDPNGKEYALFDIMGNNGLLIAFICNHCPYVKAIIDRLVEDASILQNEGIGTLAIMSNNYLEYPADSPSEMLKFADIHKFTFPYLIDEEQIVAKTYGAVCTPDFFGFNNKFELNYRGRLDDARNQDATNRKPELLDAMRLIAKTGKGPQEQFPSMGCSIKWKR